MKKTTLEKDDDFCLFYSIRYKAEKTEEARKRQNFCATRKQYDELQGLAYHNANRWRALESGDFSDSELEQIGNDVRQHFPALDALGVPYWVQNSVLRWSQNWRLCEREYMREYLKTKNITVES